MKRLSLYLFLILFTFQTPSWTGDLNTGKKRFGERWKVNVKNYFEYNVNGFSISKISYQDAVKRAMDQCKQRMRNKGLHDKAYGCLIHDIISGSTLEVLKSDEYEEIVFDKEVAKFEEQLKLDEDKEADIIIKELNKLIVEYKLGKLNEEDFKNAKKKLLD